MYIIARQGMFRARALVPPFARVAVPSDIGGFNRCEVQVTTLQKDEPATVLIKFSKAAAGD